MSINITDATNVVNKTENISVEDLSKMSGVPADFIQAELFGKDETVDIEKLRKIMLSQLDSTFMNLDLK